MKLKFLFSTAAVALMLSSVSPSHALVVSDPGAYQRFATLFQKHQQELTELKNQLEEQKKMVANISGNLKRGLGVDRTIGQLFDRVKKTTQAIQDIPGIDAAKLDPSEMEEVQNMFDVLYTPSPDIGAKAKNHKERAIYKQRTIKSALENSEFILSKQSDTLQRFDDLSKEVNETQSLKDATDLLNRLITELLIIEQQQLELMAQMARAEQAQRFTGVTSEGTDQGGSDWKDRSWDNRDSGWGMTQEKGKENAGENWDEACDIWGGC